MHIYFHSLLWSYLPRVPTILTTCVYIQGKMWMGWLVGWLVDWFTGLFIGFLCSLNDYDYYFSHVEHFVVVYWTNSHECEWMMTEFQSFLMCCSFKVFSFEPSRFSFLLWAVMESRRVLTESRLVLSYGRVHLSVGMKWLCLVVMYLFRLEDVVWRRDCSLSSFLWHPPLQGHVCYLNVSAV